MHDGNRAGNIKMKTGFSLLLSAEDIDLLFVKLVVGKETLTGWSRCLQAIRSLTRFGLKGISVRSPEYVLQSWSTVWRT